MSKIVTEEWEKMENRQLRDPIPQALFILFAHVTPIDPTPGKSIENIRN